MPQDPPPDRPAPVPATAPALPTLRQALGYWLKLGFISFGGPAGQIALMHEELVVRRRWISERRFLHALNYCMLLPGPEAQQLATYLGWLMHRTAGGLAAGVLFVLPSLLILIALSWAYLAQGHQPAVAGVLAGLKPAVAAIVAVAAVRIGRRVLRNAWLWALALGAFIALGVLKLPFPLIISAAALLGYVGGRIAPQHFDPGAPHAAGGPAAAASAIDDGTPPPPHARFTRGRFLRVLAVVLGLWLLGIGLLWAWTGWNGVLSQMARFFTGAALVTFGGAYAVLPHVMQGAVEQQGWLTMAQMIDGLALGETTPGPLIMVVAFVGYVGGWTRAILGPEALPLAGAVAACVATYFTFLPSFGFIFLGAPLIESTHGKLGFTAPLSAITAAVVGVIGHLAVLLAGHVLWPSGPDGPLQVQALAIGLAAAGVLLRGWLGVVPVVLAAGALGWLLQWQGLGG